jgi:hypothetical protein
MIGKIVFTPTFRGKRRNITDRDLALWAFIVTAVIDAVTNCFWYYNTGGTFSAADGFIYGAMKVVTYIFMIMIVFSEEVVGWGFQSTAEAVAQLLEVIRHNKANSVPQQKQNNNNRPTPTPYPLPSIGSSPSKNQQNQQNQQKQQRQQPYPQKPESKEWE